MFGGRRLPALPVREVLILTFPGPNGVCSSMVP